MNPNELDPAQRRIEFLERELYSRNMAHDERKKERDELKRKGEELCGAYGNALIKIHDIEKQRDEILSALSGLIEIGKRDMTNPKYDGYFETARAVIASVRNQTHDCLEG